MKRIATILAIAVVLCGSQAGLAVHVCMPVEFDLSWSAANYDWMSVLEELHPSEDITLTYIYDEEDVQDCLRQADVAVLPRDAAAELRGSLVPFDRRSTDIGCLTSAENVVGLPFFEYVIVVPQAAEDVDQAKGAAYRLCEIAQCMELSTPDLGQEAVWAVSGSLPDPYGLEEGIIDTYGNLWVWPDQESTSGPANAAQMTIVYLFDDTGATQSIFERFCADMDLDECEDAGAAECRMRDEDAGVLYALRSGRYLMIMAGVCSSDDGKDIVKDSAEASARWFASLIGDEAADARSGSCWVAGTCAPEATIGAPGVAGTGRPAPAASQAVPVTIDLDTNGASNGSITLAFSLTSTTSGSTCTYTLTAEVTSIHLEDDGDDLFRGDGDIMLKVDVSVPTGGEPIVFSQQTEVLLYAGSGETVTPANASVTFPPVTVTSRCTTPATRGRSTITCEVRDYDGDDFLDAVSTIFDIVSPLAPLLSAMPAKYVVAAGQTIDRLRKMYDDSDDLGNGSTTAAL